MPNVIKYPVINGRKFCPSCKQMVCVEMFRPVRMHFETRCADCKKKYAALYRQRPEVKERMVEYVRNYRSVETNRIRLNAATRKYRKGPLAKIKTNPARRLWAAKEKQKAVDFKGGKCCCCGYSGCLAAMDFHHLDPSLKDVNWGGGIRSHWGFEKNKTELEKTVLVCVRCHREIHAGYRKYEKT